MATELLYASSHLAGTFSNPSNAVGNTPLTWAGDLNTNSSYTSRWAMSDPVNPLTSGSVQTVRVVAKKGTNSGTPTIAVNLYENGVLRSALLAATSITSILGQTLTATFNASALSDPPANVEIELVESGAPGSGSVRNSAQVAYIEWTADTTAPVTVTGTGAQTLPGLSQAASGTFMPVTFTGSVAQTLPALTSSASGSHVAPVFTAESAQTLPFLSQAAAASAAGPSFVGSAEQTLPGLSQSAAGQAQAPVWTGSAAALLPGLSQAAAGSFVAPAVAAGAAQTLPFLSQAAAGVSTAPMFTATAAQTLPGLSQTLVGQSLAVAFTATVAQTLAGLAQMGAGAFVGGVATVRGEGVVLLSSRMLASSALAHHVSGATGLSQRSSMTVGSEQDG